MATRKQVSSKSKNARPLPSRGGAAQRALQRKTVQKPLEIDFRKPDSTPRWVREAIETHLAIETEDARSAGALGFMSRALVMATMPYKDPQADVFSRTNGDFKLRIVAGYEGGLPYGIYPRLLVSWVTTEAVRRQSPECELGESLTGFLRDVLELRATGGRHGSLTRVSEQMKRLFGSLITAQYTGTQSHRGFVLRNVLLAEELELHEEEFADSQEDERPQDDELWTPQKPHEAGQWKSRVCLSKSFYRECVEHPVPIDLRAYKALRGSPLAMDVYTWLTYRMSYTARKSRPIRFEALQAQFGSSFSNDDQGRRDFKKGFLKALRAVQTVYPAANVEVLENGVSLLPSRPHVLPIEGQRTLF